MLTNRNEGTYTRMSTNEASYVRGVFTFFFIVSNNRISFQLSLVFYCSFRVRFFSIPF
ncbi:hypothetical protein WDU94_013722 [Cyamophila willieti]